MCILFITVFEMVNMVDSWRTLELRTPCITCKSTVNKINGNQSSICHLHAYTHYIICNQSSLIEEEWRKVWATALLYTYKKEEEVVNETTSRDTINNNINKHNFNIKDICLCLSLFYIAKM